MEDVKQTYLDILEIDVVDYSEFNLKYAVRCSLTGDIESTHTNTFYYLRDAYTSSFACWEVWAGGDMQVLVQVKYGRNGLVEEFLQVDELEYC